MRIPTNNVPQENNINTRFPRTFKVANAAYVEWKRDVMAHAQKPDSGFQRNGRVHLYRRGCQFSRVLAFLEWGSGENDCSRVETESGGTRRRTVGEVKGKEANGVGNQTVFSFTRNSPSSVTTIVLARPALQEIQYSTELTPPPI